MSGLVVVYSRENSGVNPEVVSRMMVSLRHRGPDGSDVCNLSSVALGHQHFWTTPEEVEERQPLSDRTGRFYIVFDGRIDNREDLYGPLSCSDPSSRQISDAALILLAYEKWSESCFEKILGPFAIVLYDLPQRRIVCARDALGDRTLFYHLDHKTLLIASEESSLLAYPSLSNNLNEVHLSCYFALQTPPADGSTFFSDVSELLPGHAMVVDQQHVQIRRYWNLTNVPRLRYRCDEEYSEQFRSLLEKSVSCRLRSASTPGVLMSGGLDSTSVAALAARHLNANGKKRRLRAISYVFDELKSCDERSFIEEMYATYDLEPIQIPGDDAWPLRDAETWAQNPNTPEQNPYRLLKQRAYQAASDNGSNVLLTGAFGDPLYTGAEYWLADLLADGLFAKAWRATRSYIAESGAWRLLRGPSLRRILRSTRFRESQAPPRWLTGLAAELLPEQDYWPVSHHNFPRMEQAIRLLGQDAAHDASTAIFSASRCGIELRHPYRDRRVAEFILSVPAYQLFDGRWLKSILRNAMKGILPESIRKRENPSSLRPLFSKGLFEKEASVIRDLLIVSNPWSNRYVKSDWLTQILAGTTRSESDDLILWLCLSYEQWQARRNVKPAETLVAVG